MVEAWIVEIIAYLTHSADLVEQAVAFAQATCQADLKPFRAALALTNQALRDKETEIDTIIQTVTTGQVTGALLELLHQRATVVSAERERLKAEWPGNPVSRHAQGETQFATPRWSDCPRHRNVEPVFLSLVFIQHTSIRQ